MIVSFTGSRHGMSEQQKEDLWNHLTRMVGDIDWFHHGDCVGADAEAHEIATELGIQTHVHPPSKDSYRAFCEGTFIDEPMDYLARDRVLAEVCDILIAAPLEPTEQRRSGTWYTVRQARKLNKSIVILLR